MAGKSDIAVSFLQLASSGNPRLAFQKYVHPQFSHHNPYFNGDREALLTGMEEGAVQFPNKVFDVVRTLEDGDLVAIHGKVRLQSNMPEIALIYIFRFDGELIIEEWEAAQEVLEASPNENGMWGLGLTVEKNFHSIVHYTRWRHAGTWWTHKE